MLLRLPRPSQATYISFAIILLCTILSTAYFLGREHDVFRPSQWSSQWSSSLPSLGDALGGHGPRPVQEPAGFRYSHHAIDVAIPPGVKVIGLVFFGRRNLVQVLDCYLKRNLRENGGLLDQVIFSVKTDNKDDLAYLDQLLKTNPRYSKYVSDKGREMWLGSWEAVTEPDSVYVKIDDDVVFIEDATIPSLVKRLLESPQYFAVSANVVNNPALSWVHYSMGLHKPYWPEMNRTGPPPSPSWRASELPSYTGPLEGPLNFLANGSTPAPYEGHRWLPVRPASGQNYDISHTPVSTLTYNAHGPSLLNWAAAAQIHYSFLHHLEAGDTWRYRFDVWDYDYQRLSINFFTVRGRDILDVFPFPQRDDEEYLTVVRPKEVQRHVVVDGSALAVHFAFRPQYSAHDGKGVAWTDLLSRYRAYAKEMICAPALSSA